MTTSPNRFQAVGPWLGSSEPPLDPTQLNRNFGDVLRAMAALQPDCPAVVSADGITTFAQLQIRADVLAALITAQNAPPGPLALMLPNGPDFLAGVFAALAAGRPVLLLDPSQPAARLATLLDAAGASLVMYDGRPLDPIILAGRLGLTLAQDFLVASRLPDQLGLDDAALLLPTSGSSGVPKLVVHSQRSLMQRILNNIAVLEFTPAHRWMLVGSHANVAVSGLLAILFAGGAVCQADLLDDGATALLDAIIDLEVTNIRLVPSVFRMVARLPHARRALSRLRGLRLAGEPVRRSDLELARAMTNPDCRLENAYGATESAGFSWCWPPERLPDGPIIPAGKAKPGTEFVLVDERGRPVPSGDVGEVVTSSVGNALGDWVDGRVDARRFADDPRGNGQRVYFTGDLGRLSPDEELTVLGRKDRMVKINGMHVSLLEVEAHLQALPGCAEVVVLPWTRPDSTRLAAFIVPECGMSPPEPERWLAERLPRPMVPRRFVFVANLPRLASGKVDAALLLQSLEDAAVPSAAAPAPDALTRVVAGIWADVLRIPRPPIDADFFALGGDSLALVEVFAAIEMRFGRHVTIEHLDDSFTVARLSQLLDAGVLPISTGGVLVPLQSLGSLPPLYFVHAIGGLISHLPGLAAQIGVKRPFFAVRACADLAINLSIEKMGEVYAQAIGERHVGGPLHIAGYSFGGVIAYEVARRLIAMGYPVASLSVIDQRYPGASWRWRDLGRMLWRGNGRFFAYLRWRAGELSSKRIARVVRRWGRFLVGRPQDLATLMDTSALNPEARQIWEARRILEAHRVALRHYHPEPCRLPIAVYRARNRGLKSLFLDDSLGWGVVANGKINSHETPGDHNSILSEPHLGALTAQLSKTLVKMDVLAQIS